MSVQESTKDVITFRARNSEGAVHYFDKASPNGNNYPPVMRPSFHLANALDVDDVEGVVRMYQRLVKDYGVDRVEIIRLQVVVRETTMDLMAKDEFLEERRKQALAKLQPDDIEALGLQKLATYNKLRYHNLDDNIQLP